MSTGFFVNTKNNSRRKNSVEKTEKAYMELLRDFERKDVTVSLVSEKANIPGGKYKSKNPVLIFEHGVLNWGKIRFCFLF